MIGSNIQKPVPLAAVHFSGFGWLYKYQPYLVNFAFSRFFWALNAVLTTIFPYRWPRDAPPLTYKGVNPISLNFSAITSFNFTWIRGLHRLSTRHVVPSKPEPDSLTKTGAVTFNVSVAFPILGSIRRVFRYDGMPSEEGADAQIDADALSFNVTISPGDSGSDSAAQKEDETEARRMG